MDDPISSSRSGISESGFSRKEEACSRPGRPISFKRSALLERAFASGSASQSRKRVALSWERPSLKANLRGRISAWISRQEMQRRTKWKASCEGNRSKRDHLMEDFLLDQIYRSTGSGVRHKPVAGARRSRDVTACVLTSAQ